MYQHCKNLAYLSHPGQGKSAPIPLPSTTANLKLHFKEFDLKNDWKKLRKNDQYFINTFLSKIKITKTGLPNESLKIFEAKQLLIEIILMKKKLECKASSLDVNDESFDVQWGLIENKMSIMNEKIIKLQLSVKDLQKKICKRLKSRKAKKKKKCNEKMIKKEKKIDIERRHKIIDQLLSEKLEEVNDAKREISLKNKADAVLHEVRRKKYEANKMLKMLSALSLLRELRVKQEEKIGGYCSKQLTKTFNKVIERFQLLWEKQSEIYKLEEKGLKIMLGENAFPLVKESKFETNLLQWEEVLFGNITTDIKERVLTAADNSLEAFIQIRKDWDKFLTQEATPVSSNIPVGWIIPPVTNDEDWKKFIFDKKKCQC